MAVPSIRISCVPPASLTCWRRSWGHTPLRSGAVLRAAVSAALLCCLTSVAAASDSDLTCKSAAEVSAALAAHRIGSQALITGYEARISRLKPEIHAVIALNPKAMDAAHASDARRAAGGALGPLDGLPILVKD